MAITERAKKEEREILQTLPIREANESETYWNTRVLAYSICQKHYRTPQYNMDCLLIEFLNSNLPSSSQIDKDKSRFIAQGENNLKFSIRDSFIVFNAHKPINKDIFLQAFGLKDKTK
jgi:hypothetical protein